MADFNHAYIGQLVEEAKDGNSNAFAELYAMTYQHIFNYAAHYLRDEVLAQDALQETYILALRNINGLKESNLFVAWLNQICFRVCYDMARKNWQQASEINSELMELIRDEYRGHNPEEQAVRDDEMIRLQDAVNSLPFNEQQVIVMRYYNDMKIEEIASALQISRSTVKRHLISARERLAQNILKGGDR